jgi:hypothetical protein
MICIKKDEDVPKEDKLELKLCLHHDHTNLNFF